MNRDHDQILSEAVAWHLASGDDAMDWDAFTLWLEADPRHAASYDEVALADAALADHRDLLADIAPVTAPAVANEVFANANDSVVIPAGGWRRHWRWGGLAIAASLAALLVAPQVMTPAPQVFDTMGTGQRIALDDGSSIMLAPRSHLTIEGRHQDRIALSGGALFDIRHDPDRQLTITTGNLAISDIGTVFDVQAQDGSVRVAVVEGKVAVSGDALTAPVELAAGRGLDFDARSGTATVAPVAADDVASWRKGRLSYDNARLALVVADLQRYAGVKVDVPADLKDRRFSGTLIVDDGDAALHDLAKLMGLDLAGPAGARRLERAGR